MTKTIWVVDDDPSILEVVQIVLEEAGYEVVLLDSFELVKKRLIKSQPDLILLDILMKGVDGRDIAKYIKSRKKASKIPIIMLSADHKAEEKAKEAGVEDLVKKPFNIDDLTTAVRKYA